MAPNDGTANKVEKRRTRVTLVDPIAIVIVVMLQHLWFQKRRAATAAVVLKERMSNSSLPNTMPLHSYWSVTTLLVMYNNAICVRGWASLELRPNLPRHTFLGSTQPK